MKFSKYVFSIAGIYGIIVLLPQYFMETKNGLDHPPAINHPEYYYGFIGVALAWQFVFLIIARAPEKFRSLMIPAIFENAGFGLPAIFLYFADRLAFEMLFAGLIDLVLGVLFITAFFKVKSSA